MTFIKYTNDGKAVIQPAALTLSGLEQEETLEMHTLENAIVLLKQEMEPVEKAAAMMALIRLTNSLWADMLAGWRIRRAMRTRAMAALAAARICCPFLQRPLRMPASCTTTSVWSAWTALFWWCPMTAKPSGRPN